MMNSDVDDCSASGTPNMASYLSGLRSLPNEFRSSLKSFASASSAFRVVKSTQSQQISQPELSDTAPDRLYVLDSSFNPPTRGHMDIALSALKADASPSKHLLLLLSTQNADKPSKPAPFEQRMVMMTILADNLVSAFTEDPASSTSDDPGTTPHPELTVHVGITKHPYFIDKSDVIAGGAKSSASSGQAPDKDSSSETPFAFPPTRQTHLIGFDTFTRLMDPKYYDGSLKALAPLFKNHSVRVTMRTDDGFGSEEDQHRYLQDIAEGKRDGDGAEKDWAKQVQLVKGINNTGKLTSSTRAREAAKSGEKSAVEEMCGERIAGWVAQEGLYKDAA